MKKIIYYNIKDNCSPKNPNWDPNWRDKRNKEYNTYKPKDYIIKNFVFEEIKVGV
jgi:hypothetical protein